MLRSCECFFKFKCSEVRLPFSFPLLPFSTLTRSSFSLLQVPVNLREAF